MFPRHTTANENVNCEQRPRRLSSHDSLLSIFRGVDMFLRHITADENVMCGHSSAWRQVA